MIAAAAAAFLTLAALAAIDNVVFAAVVLLVALAGVAMAAGVLWTSRRRLPWLCDPLLLAFAFLSQFYVIGAIAYQFVGSGDLPFMRQFSPWRAAEASASFLVFVGMILLGYQSGLGTALERLIPDFSYHRLKPDGKWAEAVILLTSLGGCYWWLDYQGGLAAKLREGYSAGKPGSAIFALAHLGLVVGTLLMGWRVFSKSKQWWLDKAMFGSLLFVDAIFLGVIVGVRKYLFFLYFGLITIWILRRGWQSLPKVRIAVALAGLLAFFSLWGAVRARPLGEMLSGTVNPRVINDNSVREYVSGFVDPYSVACLVWDLFPSVERHRHGSTILVSVFGFIPRRFWMDKPIGIGKEITRYIIGPYYEEYYGFSVTVTLPADFYLNFGWFGIVFGGIFVGGLCRAVTEYALHGMIGGLQQSAARVLIPSAFVIGLGEVRSDMATMMSTYGLLFMPLLFALTFFSFDAAPGAPPPGPAPGAGS